MQPRLITTQLPKSPEGVALVLHGGASRGEEAMVSPTQLSVLRLIPIAARIAREGRGRLAVFRLLNSARGWDTRHTPVDDVRWALGQIGERLDPGLPTALVGHSLGGRAALLSGAEGNITTVVALAPWLYSTDRATTGPQRRIFVVHGSADRIANPQTSAAVARSAHASFISVKGGKHAMLKRHRIFDRLASELVTGTLLGAVHNGAAGRALRGESSIEV